MRAPSHVKNGMFNVKKRKYGKRTIKVEIGKFPRIVATLRAAFPIIIRTKNNIEF